MSQADNACPQPGRRQFIAAGAASLTLAAAGRYTSAVASAHDPAPSKLFDARGSINALVFDVFGTVVDWRGSIIREGELLGSARASM